MRIRSIRSQIYYESESLLSFAKIKAIEYNYTRLHFFRHESSIGAVLKVLSPAAQQRRTKQNKKGSNTTVFA